MPQEVSTVDIAGSALSKGQARAHAMKVLAQKAADGDRVAFGELIGAQYDFIFATAFKWSGNRDDAEDLAQDICVKLARIIKSYDGRAAFSTWLYRVVINAVHDLERFRMRQRKKASELKEIALMEILPDQEQSALQNELWAAVRALPDRQRDAMLLVYGEEKTHAECAIIMECKEATVSGHIHVAKKTLKKLL